MKILAVDDKEMPLKVLERAIREAAPDAEVFSCASSAKALALSESVSFDVAFLDIDLPGMSGIALARELKGRNPKVNIVFATGFDEYMSDAFALRSSGYLMKPITPDAVAIELENLRFPPAMPLRNSEGRLVVRCFGNFEVFANGQPVAFGRTKSKELLAYLVDRMGSVVSLRDAEVVLWEDAPRTGKSSGSYMRTIIADLRHSLSACGHDDVLVRRRGALGINPSRIMCDYYAFLANDPIALTTWHGEYMEQYTWAEATKAALLQQP